MTSKKKTPKQLYQKKVESSLNLAKSLIMEKFPDPKNKIRIARMAESHFVYSIAFPYTIIKILNDEFELDWYDYMIKHTKPDESGLFDLLHDCLAGNEISSSKLDPNITTKSFATKEKIEKALKATPDVIEEGADLPKIDLRAQARIEKSLDQDDDVDESVDDLEPLSAKDIADMQNMLK